eukprot:TRINITY_DN9213_c0_g1::TRINITY_DN9213_c0_g1_i1::g.12489::m.12489 TRINITY_DN9213_c0_g1::TRINITY_DN9213_c0_g1_i1::g.12489  ORF type:complete len:341 (+),score=31.08,RD3/PF14473.1/4.3e+03,RD3/PF14473.1/0.14 TRINITY_DN9213_c0_g1_i1:45-1025(+)
MTTLNASRFGPNETIKLNDIFSLAPFFRLVLTIQDPKKSSRGPEVKDVTVMFRSLLESKGTAVFPKPVKESTDNNLVVHLDFNRADHFEEFQDRFKPDTKLNCLGIELNVVSCESDLKSTASDIIFSSRRQFMAPSALKGAGKSNPTFESLPPGKRPDTIIVRRLPQRWFAREDNRDQIDESALREIFETLCRTLFPEKSNDIFVRYIHTVPTRKDETDEVSSMLSQLDFDVYVQFFTFEAFCEVVRTLCGRVLVKEGAKRHCRYTVEYDRSSYFFGKDRDVRSSSVRTVALPEANLGESSWKRSNSSRENDNDSDDANPKRLRFA